MKKLVGTADAIAFLTSILFESAGVALRYTVCPQASASKVRHVQPEKVKEVEERPRNKLGILPTERRGTLRRKSHEKSNLASGFSCLNYRCTIRYGQRCQPGRITQ